MFAGLVAWIMRGGLSGIAEQLQVAHRNKLQAETDETRFTTETV